MRIPSEIKVLRSAVAGLRAELGTLTPAEWETPGACGVWSVAEVIAHLAWGADLYAGLIRRDMVRPGAVVIDVGVNRVEDPSAPKGYRLVGDVAFEEVCEVASAITPVPGGVGPMTRAMLMSNTVDAALALAAPGGP